MNLSPREAEATVLQHRIPLASQRFLHVNCGPGLLCGVTNRRCGAETTGVYLGDDSAEQAIAEEEATHVADTLSEAAEMGAPFDCIVISGMPAADAADTRARCAEFLVPDGYIVILCGEALPGPDAPLAHYATWPIDAAQAELEEEFIPASNAPRVEVYTRSGYDPLTHAQQLAGARQFDRAYEILCAVPPGRRSDAALDARVQILKMACLLGLQRLGAYPPLTCLAAGVFLFARVQRRLPNQPETFRLVARFWEAVGDARTGARYRIIADELGGTLPTAPLPPATPEAEPTAALWTPTTSPPRVLFVMGDSRTNYGLDVLYHGLKLVLGEDNVVEYPHKPSLHGVIPEKFAHYPALFNHDGASLDPEALLTKLRAKEFDLIAWGDTEMELDPPLARALRAAAGDTPLVFVDMRDDCADHVPDLCAWLGLAAPPACFKRELLSATRYTGDPTPLPFAYADEYVVAQPENVRECGLFWAGQRGWGLRDVFLPVLESRGIDTTRSYAQDAYRNALRDARACLNLAGAGFDTVRHWEAPAQGCLLLTETLPIRLPHNFTDMANAIYFDTPRELGERLDYLDAHPDHAETIRLAGWQHLCAHHTATARAKQFLAKALPQ